MKSHLENMQDFIHEMEKHLGETESVKDALNWLKVAAPGLRHIAGEANNAANTLVWAQKEMAVLATENKALRTAIHYLTKGE